MTAESLSVNSNRKANRLSHFNETTTEILDRVQATVLITDKLGKIIHINPATEKLGLKYEQLVGKKVINLVKDGIYNRSLVLEVLKTLSVKTGIVKIKTQAEVDLIVTCIPILDERGSIKFVLTTGHKASLMQKDSTSFEKEATMTDGFRDAINFLTKTDYNMDVPVAESPQMSQIIEICNRVAKTDSTVIITGESGTGKEKIAEFIHKNGPRCNGPFVAYNCAAIPRELLESEFFGYVSGAFTGASNQGKPGLFEMANNGTLFLDEIGELPLEMQSKLLRGLDKGEVRRLGGTAFLKTNARVIAATNRDLKEMVGQNEFRKDLYYRLNIFPIHLPPLKERPEDILPLAKRFLKEINNKYGLNKKLTTQVEQAFLSYDWPGNARELRNIIERLIVISGNDEIYFLGNMLEGKTEFRNGNRQKFGNGLGDSTNKGTLKDFLKETEKKYIKQVMEECNGRIGEAASRLGIHRTMLYRKLKEEV